MLDALREIVLGLISSFIFAQLVRYYNKWHSAAPSPAAEATHEPGRTDSRPSPGSTATDRTTSLWQRRSFDTTSFAWLVGLSITVVVPFLLGGMTLAVIDEATNNSSPFITEQMRQEGDYGYVQYWLGFSILAVIEVAVLLLRPWKGRAFGVALGIALAVFLVVFGIPASRGERFF